jgi:hypothetical protein
VSRLDDELGALASLSPAQLREKWNGLEGSHPPSVPSDLLRRLLAQRLQERRHGELPRLVARELIRLGDGQPVTNVTRPSVKLTPGTRLVREWNGQTISVEVLEEGFAFADRT